MKRSQDGAFSIGVKCAVPDCDHTVLFDSSYCTNHKARRATSKSEAKLPVYSNPRKRLLGPESKLVARKSESVLRTRSFTKPAVSTEPPNSRKTVATEEDDSMKQFRETIFALIGERDPTPQSKGTQVRNPGAPDTLSSNGKATSQHGFKRSPVQSPSSQNNENRLSTSRDPPGTSRHTPQPFQPARGIPDTDNNTNCWHNPTRSQTRSPRSNGNQKRFFTLQAHPQYARHKSQSAQSIADPKGTRHQGLSQSFGIETKFSEARVSKSKHDSLDPNYNKRIDGQGAQEFYGYLLSTESPNPPLITSPKPVNGNAHVKDSITFRPTGYERSHSSQLLGKRKIDAISSSRPNHDGKLAAVLPFNASCAQNEQAIDGIQPAVMPGQSIGGLEANEGKGDSSCTVTAESTRTGTLELQRTDSLSSGSELSSLESSGLSTPPEIRLDRKATKPTPVIGVESQGVKRPEFDSDAFDALIYRQPNTSQLSKLPTPSRLFPRRTGLRTLLVNPAIHGMFNRSEYWWDKKQKEIAARPRRKAWFGKAAARMRWLDAQETAQEEERQTAERNRAPSFRKDPQPWTAHRARDFSDVPEQDLPEDVRKNPAYLRACAWLRGMKHGHEQNNVANMGQKRTISKDAQRQASLRRAQEETERFYNSLINGQRSR